MAISKGFRFPFKFDEASPHGLAMVGEVSPDNEYQSREDRAAGRPTRQRADESTGKRQWKVTVTDPSEPNANCASYEVTFLAEMQSVSPASSVLPGIRPLELGFKHRSSVNRDAGFKAVASGGGSKPEQREQAAKAA